MNQDKYKTIPMAKLIKKEDFYADISREMVDNLNDFCIDRDDDGCRIELRVFLYKNQSLHYILYVHKKSVVDPEKEIGNITIADMHMVQDYDHFHEHHPEIAMILEDYILKTNREFTIEDIKSTLIKKSLEEEYTLPLDLSYENKLYLEKRYKDID